MNIIMNMINSFAETIILSFLIIGERILFMWLPMMMMILMMIIIFNASEMR